MKNKVIMFFLVIMVCNNLVSAFLISDQGTNVREVATGNLTELANLTISIYDASTEGNLIFQQNFSDAIINGSWNVMINPNLEYGKSYYKDYNINEEDLDFDGNERLQFQSSVGGINNVSFINFSLIDSCSAGSSIRLIYGNGSVECETDDNSGTTDLTNYALKNQSETFSGNITTSQTGFFGWLGSLVSRVTKLFVQDIDFNGTINGSGNIVTTENVTASYFIGDGSQLTNLPAGSESDPIFIAENSTLWNAINNKLAETDQKYNETTLILSVNTTSNIMSLDFYNKSEVDSLISGVSGGNLSFNQSLTDTLYASIIWGYNQTQPAIDYVDAQGFITSGIENNTAGWILNFTKIYSDDWSNVTITESQISDLGSYLTEESDPLFTAENASLWAEAKNKYNATYAQWSYNQTTPAIEYANNINTTLSSRIDGISGGNSSFNQSLTDSLYSGIEWDYNQTTPANAYTDSVNASTASWIESVFAKIVDVFTKSEIQEQYYNKSDVYNKTETDNLIPDVTNYYTKSEVDTNLSYYLLLTDERYNETDYIDNLIADYYNKSYVYNTTEVDALIPDVSNYYTKAEVDNNFTLYLLLTDQRFNETTLINNLISSVNATANIQALGFYNQTEVDSLITNLNETDLVLTVNSSLWSYINANEASWLSTYNETYANWAYNQTAPANAYTDMQINAINTTANIDSLGYLNKSGTNANQNINISPYNITTSDTGFFGWLGSLTSRITKLWVVDINATGNIETSENITATYVKLGGGGYMYDNGTTLILGRD